MYGSNFFHGKNFCLRHSCSEQASDKSQCKSEDRIGPWSSGPCRRSCSLATQTKPVTPPSLACFPFPIAFCFRAPVKCSSSLLSSQYHAIAIILASDENVELVRRRLASCAGGDRPHLASALRRPFFPWVRNAARARAVRDPPVDLPARAIVLPHCLFPPDDPRRAAAGPARSW
jgi:hypothetical protein